MKILLIAPAPPPYGGIANWTLLMRKYIKKQKGQDIEFLNIAPKSRSLDGRTLWDRVVRQGLNMFKKNSELKYMINQGKVDVIHMTTSGQLAIIRDLLLLKTAKVRNVPAIYHIHFGRIPEIAANNTWEWKLISKALKLSSAVIAIDDATNKCINTLLPDVNVVYVPNPIDLSVLPVSTEIVNKEIVFLGWNVKTKGVEELIKAWNSVGERFSEYCLNLVGPLNSDYLCYLKSITSVENVTFSGEMPHDKAMNILNACCIFVLPSYTEGCPNVVLEAMALKKPIIATNVGAIPEMLADDCGILIKPQSTEEVKQALIELLENEQKRAELSQNAYKKAVNYYNIDNVYKQYYDVWNIVTRGMLARVCQ